MMKRKFSLKEVQQLILDGWNVEGDRQHAYRNGQATTPTIYRQQQAKRSEQQTN